MSRLSLARTALELQSLRDAAHESQGSPAEAPVLPASPAPESRPGRTFDTVWGEALVLDAPVQVPLVAPLLPGLLLFTRWFVGRVSGDQSLARAKYSRTES